MTGVIMKWGGTIDEFIGDAILVLFGAPVLRPDDHIRAAACALEMQREMAAVNAMNREKSLPEIEMGIGIHTGEVVVGNIGSTRRAKYGVVGRSVNFASRIESYTVGGQVLISPALFTALGPLAELGADLDVQPKGMRPVILHDLLGLGGDIGIRLERPVRQLDVLRTELPCRFIIVEGKDARGTERTGAVVALSADVAEAEVRAEEGVRPFANLRLVLEELPVVEVYAKVVAGHARVGRFIVRFTSVPDPARQVLAAAVT
jgi:adenylate cyclase